MFHQFVTSIRNLWSACVETQQPVDNKPFKIHFKGPSEALRESRGAKVFVSTLCPTSNGRLRATPPAAPKAFPANRHTVRQQDRDERPRQRVRTASVSAESQSERPSSRQEPHRRIRAVLWSRLRHRKSKEIRAGARTSPAHSASLWRDELKGRMASTAERPSRKNPTEGALWSCKTVIYRRRSNVDLI